MKWVSALSLRINPLQAFDEACAQLTESLAEEPTLILLFATGHHLAAFPHFASELQSRFPAACVVGCSAQGVIGAGREVERREGLSIMAGVLPGVTAIPVRLGPEDVPDAAWCKRLQEETGEKPHLILLPDPFSTDVEAVLKALDTHLPAATRTGGLVSGAEGPFESTLLLNDELYHDGLVGVALSGALQIEPLLSQGCRPVGEPMIVTRVKDNVVYELNVGRPTEALQQLYKQLSPRDQQLCHTSLFLGVERKTKSKVSDGSDYLIGDVMGMDPNSGAMAIGRAVRNYQVVQFHLRDADTAKKALRGSLKSVSDDLRKRLRGVLMFNCAGRGEGLYGTTDHDSNMVLKAYGEVPVGGFFSNGEIGPTAEATHIHGYAVVVDLLCEPEQHEP